MITLVNKVENILDHVTYAHDCFIAYFSILQIQENENEKINLAPGFFTIVTHSLVQTMIMTLSRLYCSKDEDDICFTTLLKSCRSPENLKIDEHKKVLIINLSNQMASDIDHSSAIIEKIRLRRNKAYAHNDKSYFLKPNRMIQELSVSKEELEHLLFLAGEFCSKLFTILTSRVVIPYTVNSNDIQNLIKHVQ